jgi:hypothetical protein
VLAGTNARTIRESFKGIEQFSSGRGLFVDQHHLSGRMDGLLDQLMRMPSLCAFFAKVKVLAAHEAVVTGNFLFHQLKTQITMEKKHATVMPICGFIPDRMRCFVLLQSSHCTHRAREIRVPDLAVLRGARTHE